jgi:hypothetical protein
LGTTILSTSATAMSDDAYDAGMMIVVIVTINNCCL